MHSNTVKSSLDKIFFCLYAKLMEVISSLQYSWKFLRIECDKERPSCLLKIFALLRVLVCIVLPYAFIYNFLLHIYTSLYILRTRGSIVTLCTSVFILISDCCILKALIKWTFVSLRHCTYYCYWFNYPCSNTFSFILFLQFDVTMRWEPVKVLIRKLILLVLTDFHAVIFRPSRTVSFLR